MKSISVVMAVHNGSKFLRESLNSVIFQLADEDELIVIDDASSDNSLEIINEYKKSVKIIKNSTNIGQTKSLNIGIKNAKGDIIVRLDADDFFLSNHLSLHRQSYEQDKNLVMFGSSVIIIDDDGNKGDVIGESLDTKGMICKSLIQTPICHPAMSFKRIINNIVYFYDENYRFAQDYELQVRLLYKGECKHSQNATVAYRVHKNAISHEHSSEQKVHINNANSLAKAQYIRIKKINQSNYGRVVVRDIISLDVGRFAYLYGKKEPKNLINIKFLILFLRYVLKRTKTKIINRFK